MWCKNIVLVLVCLPCLLQASGGQRVTRKWRQPPHAPLHVRPLPLQLQYTSLMLVVLTIQVGADTEPLITAP